MNDKSFKVTFYTGSPKTRVFKDVANWKYNHSNGTVTIIKDVMKADNTTSMFSRKIKEKMVTYERTVAMLRWSDIFSIETT